jgi:Mrp family chromosome partitioning ATPase
MRDTYAAHDLPKESEAKLAGLRPSGMRHSIRPRRGVLDQDQDQDQAKAQDEPLTSNALTTTPPAESYFVADPNAPRWQDLQLANPGEKRARTAAMPVVDSRRDSPTVRAFDLLRTRLRQTTQDNNWRNIAIVSPTTGCGTTFTAVNLALSLSRVPGSRTVLMDMNLRDPGVANAFDMTAPGTLRDLLDGTIPMQQHLQRVGLTSMCRTNSHNRLLLECDRHDRFARLHMLRIYLHQGQSK